MACVAASAKNLVRCAMPLTLLLAALAHGQDYRFPTADAHYGYWYPTAYYDHGGVTDWACGGITYGGHQGSDFGAGSFAGMDAGRDVVAALDGTVELTNDGEFDRCTTGDCYGGGGYGNYVKVRHSDGKGTIYAHLAQWSVAVSPGEFVTCGQHLGRMGSSGYSTGPHLHFEVRGPAEERWDPFDGPCSAPPSYWVDQGAHGAVPGPTCEGPSPPCAPVGTLTCGDVVVSSNDGAGHTQHVWRYGCAEWTYAGPEIAWEVVTDRAEPVTLSLTGLSADLDLYALTNAACDGGGCIAGSVEGDASDELIVYDAAAEVPVVAVVDGWEGAVSGFTLTVSCAGGLPGETTGTTGTTTTPTTGTTPSGGDTGDTAEPVFIPPVLDTDTGDTGPESDDPDPPDDAPPRQFDEAATLELDDTLITGCGCATGAPATGWWTLAAVVGLRRRGSATR
ncbi:MAG: hypothetical protein ACI8PZ_003233 [Myxococcota bacterium]